MRFIFIFRSSIMIKFAKSIFPIFEKFLNFYALFVLFLPALLLHFLRGGFFLSLLFYVILPCVFLSSVLIVFNATSFILFSTSFTRNISFVTLYFIYYILVLNTLVISGCVQVAFSVVKCVFSYQVLPSFCFALVCLSNGNFRCQNVYCFCFPCL